MLFIQFRIDYCIIYWNHKEFQSLKSIVGVTFFHKILTSSLSEKHRRLSDLDHLDVITMMWIRFQVEPKIIF